MASIVETVAGTSYTLSAADDDKILRFTSSSAITVICPDTLLEGVEVVCIQAGAGQITFTESGTATFLNSIIPVSSGERAYIAVTLEADATYMFNGKIGQATDLPIQMTAWEYDAATSKADPSTGFFRLNNADFTLATEMYLNYSDLSGLDMSSWMSDLPANSHIRLGQSDNNSASALFEVGTVTDETGYFTITVTYIATGGDGLSTGSKYVYQLEGGGSASGSDLPVDDTTSIVQDPVDNTKQMRIDAGAITTGNVRTMSMPDNDVDLADIATNNAKVTNATHTGDVTGSGALTIDPTAITNKTTVTAASGDFVLISDTDDSGNLKKVDAADFLGGGSALTVQDGTTTVNNVDTIVFTNDGSVTDDGGGQVTVNNDGSGGGADPRSGLLTMSTNQNNPSVNDTVEFDGTDSDSDLDFDSISHRVTLRSGIKVKLEATMYAGSFTGSGDLRFQWYDVTNATYIGMQSILGNTDNGDTTQSVTMAHINPSTDIEVELRVVSVAGTPNIEATWCGALITEISGSAGSSSGGGSATVQVDKFELPFGTGTSEGWTEDVGAWSNAQTDSSPTGIYKINGGTDGAAISQEISLPTSGEWFCRLFAERNNNHGIIDLTVDGGSVLGSWDQYSATQDKAAIGDEISLGALTAGTVYSIELTVNGKNASSSDENVALISLQIYRKETVGGGSGGSVANPQGVFYWSGSNIVLSNDSGISSVVRNSIGDYTVTLAEAQADTQYSVLISGSSESGLSRNICAGVNARTTTTFKIVNEDSDGNPEEAESTTPISFVVGQINASGTNKIDYSTSEQKTGRKWINGKDEYQKTLSVAAINVGTDTIAHGVTGIDVNSIRFVSQGSNYSDGSTSLTLPHINEDTLGDSIRVRADNTNVYVDTNGDFTGWSGYVTIKYTQT